MKFTITIPRDSDANTATFENLNRIYDAAYGLAASGQRIRLAEADTPYGKTFYLPRGVEIHTLEFVGNDGTPAENKGAAMSYVKEHYKGRCAIMSDSYSRRVAYLELLVAEALRDFPILDGDSIEFQIYGGTSRNRTVGVEFVAPEGIPIPDSYREVDGLEDRY